MREHGSFEMEVRDQTLIVKCVDSWNIETVIRMCREYKQLAATICDQPWACLVDMTEWVLATPEMWAEIDKLNDWGNKHNQKFEAVVCSLALQKSLMVQSHEVLTNVETKFCKDLPEAYQWLADAGMLEPLHSEWSI
ncbi:hypothetical protein EXU30_08135 [Shewanella maritima]|uniref:STAS/SEC14 domain-containing protein n=1 Tax=Shewanella maritima TaxID=2520507 RepID=A0A411PGD2_9GAMM|nr:hypothetical protein [Shewanella maritima]QBF82659.1 hypothetical protein EXU30_08135 [Shewanella maritima]